VIEAIGTNVSVDSLNSVSRFGIFLRLRSLRFAESSKWSQSVLLSLDATTFSSILGLEVCRLLGATRVIFEF